MSMLEHAQYELNAIRCSEPEKSALLAAVEGFAQGGWSGGSAGWGIATLERLLLFKPLSALTSEPSEWNLVQGDETAQTVVEGEKLWQSRRRPTTFSRDGGRTWYDIDDESLNNGDAWVRDDATWIQLELGVNARVGARVKVKADAYSSEGTGLAGRHNGRVGDVVLVDSGVCVVRYADGSTYRHVPAKLDVLRTTE